MGLAAAPRPSRRIDDGGRQVLDLGGLSAVVEHHGHAHTRTDLTVLVPEAGVLFAGDLVEESGPPQHGLESDLAGWPGVLGAVVDAAFVRAQREALAAAPPG